MGKELFKIILTIVFYTSVQAQQGASVIKRSADATEALQESVEQISLLDENLDKSYCANFSSTNYQKYRTRLTKAEQQLKALKEIEKEFSSLSESDQNERDYFIKLAYTDLIALNIYHRRQEFLEFLKIYAQTNLNDKEHLAEYERKMDEWEAEHKRHTRQLRKRVGNIKYLSPNNHELLVMDALLKHYEGHTEQAILTLEEAMQKMNPNQTGSGMVKENSEVNNMGGYLNGWLSYFFIYKDDYNKAQEYLTRTLTYDEPAEIIQWAELTKKKLEQKKLKCADIKIVPLDFAKATGFNSNKTFVTSYKDGNEVTGSLTGSFVLQPKDEQVTGNPQQLIDKTELGWQRLVKLENEPWEMAKVELKDAKKPYADPNNIYVAISPKNKGFSQRNLNLFTKRFQEAYAIVNTLKYAQSGWSGLIRTNPAVPFYTIYRIKTNLALHHMQQSMQDYLQVLNYLKIKNEKIPTLMLNEIKADFDNGVLPEIRSDLENLKNLMPENPLYYLTKIEVATYTETPAQALQILEETAKKIPANVLIGETDPHRYVEMYRSYLYFKLRDMKKLDQSLQLLGQYHNTHEWIKDLQNKKRFLEDEKTIIEKNQ